jgi:hypothetical protein
MMGTVGRSTSSARPPLPTSINSPSTALNPGREFVLFGMQNGVCGPYLISNHKILISVLMGTALNPGWGF